MATRLYGQWQTSAPISPAPAAGWESTGLMLRCAAALTRATPQVAAPTTVGTGVAGDDVLVYQQIFGPVAAQVIGGTGNTVKGQNAARQASSLSNARAQLVIRVIAADGTVRGTALDFDTAADAQDFNVSGSVRINRKFPRSGAVTLAQVNALAGDYIVIEQGYRNHGTNTGAIRINDLATSDGAAYSIDLPEDETTNPVTGLSSAWIEFSQTLRLYVPASAIVHGVGVSSL